MEFYDIHSARQHKRNLQKLNKVLKETPTFLNSLFKEKKIKDSCNNLIFISKHLFVGFHLKGK